MAFDVMKVGDDQKSVDRLIATVLDRDKERLPYAHLLAEVRVIPMGALAAWLLYGTQPDIGEKPKIETAKWDYFMSRARCVSYRLCQMKGWDDWTRAELIRWGRIGGWRKQMDTVALADIASTSVYGPCDGYGREAPFFYFWVINPEIETFIANGTPPSWRPTTPDHEPVWRALLRCFQARMFRIPADRVEGFRRELIEWVGFTDKRLMKLWGTHFSAALFSAVGSSKFSNHQLQEASQWSTEAAQELADRRLGLDDPEGPNAGSWVERFLENEPMPDDWRRGLGEYANASKVRKRALWNHLHDMEVVDPRCPFGKGSLQHAPGKIKLEDLLGEEPPYPSYKETAEHFGIRTVLPSRSFLE